MAAKCRGKGELMSYQAGDMVLYGTQGICRITDVTQKDFNGSLNLYYVLEPLYDDKSTIYVPVHNEMATAKLRHILSAVEVHDLIRTIPDESTIWVENMNERRERYKAIISSGDRKELVKLIKTLYEHQQNRKNEGKQPYTEDERIMKSAEKILYEEFAHVLHIQPEQVVPFITQQISIEEKTLEG